jgi:hypothetical protein
MRSQQPPWRTYLIFQDSELIFQVFQVPLVVLRIIGFGLFGLSDIVEPHCLRFGQRKHLFNQFVLEFVFGVLVLNRFVLADLYCQRFLSCLLLASPTTPPRQERRHASNTKLQCSGQRRQCPSTSTGALRGRPGVRLGGSAAWLLDLLTVARLKNCAAVLAFALRFWRSGGGRSRGARSVHTVGL